MPKGPVPAELHPFLSAPNVAVLATIRKDGSIATAGTWYFWQDEGVLLSIRKGSSRERNLQRNPEIGITVLSASGYDHVSLSGRVVEFRDDPDMVDTDRLSMYYWQRPYPKRGIACTTVIVDVASWHSFGDPVAAARG